jgi:hypothetical protein
LKRPLLKLLAKLQSKLAKLRSKLAKLLLLLAKPLQMLLAKPQPLLAKLLKLLLPLPSNSGQGTKNRPSGRFFYARKKQSSRAMASARRGSGWV